MREENTLHPAATLHEGRESLTESHASIAIPHGAGFWRRLLTFMGPAFLISVGYMDPGNWATDIEGGARFRYQLLWVILLSNLAAILLQTLCVRLGLVARRDLAQACREQYSRPVAVALWLLAEVAIAACDLAEVLGSAIALKLLFHIPLLPAVLLTALDVLLLLALQRFGMRLIEAVVVTLVATIAGCYMVEIFLSRPDWPALGRGLVTPSLNRESLYISLGILGATVMPHNLYLHSALVQTRNVGRSEKEIRSALKYNLLETVIALNGAFFVNAAILVMAAATFYGKHEVSGIQDAYATLRPLLGSLASTVFAVALLASGQSSTITGTLAGQVIMEGFVHLRVQPWLRRLITRSLAIIPAVIVIALNARGSEARQNQAVESLLVLSQVVLSLQLSFATIPLVLFTGDRKRMGNFVNPVWLQMLSWSVVIGVALLNVWLLYTQFAAWTHSNARAVWLLTCMGGSIAAFGLGARWFARRPQTIVYLSLLFLLLTGGQKLIAAPAPNAALPLLKQMNAQGWKPDAPLREQITALGVHTSHGVRVQCYQVRYYSHDWRGKPVWIFGFYGVPHDGRGLHPGLLMLHGGGGYATLDRVIENGARGFATLSIDLPGKGVNRDRFSRSSGPDMTVPQIFTVTPALTDNYLYHAVVASRRALTFLATRREVDPHRLGVMGASWGGVIGLLTTSVDNRVRCLVDIFGSGFVREGSVWQGYFQRLSPAQFARWESNFDASQYVRDIHVPVLGVTATNDSCYWLPQFAKTMRLISPEPRLLTVPNLSHKLDAPAVAGYYRWLQNHLMAGAKPLTPVPWMRVRGSGSDLGVSFYSKGKMVPTSVALTYVPVTQLQLARHQWRTVRCKPESWRWTAHITASAPLTMIFATAHYPDGTEYSTTVHSLVQTRLHGRLLALDVPFLHSNTTEVQRYYAQRAVRGCTPENDDRFWHDLLLSSEQASPVYPSSGDAAPATTLARL